MWGEKDANGNILDAYSRELETEPCERSSVNFAGDENQDAYEFWKPHPNTAQDLNRFFYIFQCIKDDYVLMGDYNSAQA